MKKVHIGLFIALLGIAAVCYAHAGMYDRYVDMMEVLYAIIKTIFAAQLVAYLVIVVKWSKWSLRIRMKLLFLAKRLCKNQWINIFAAWALSSFVLTSYWYVFCSAFWLMGIIPLVLFWCLYLIVVLRKEARIKLLSGVKAIYLYLITSIGQGVVFVLLLSTEILWYIPVNEYTEPLMEFLCYTYRIYSFRPPFDENGIYFIAKEGMWQLTILLAIPYLLLLTCFALRSVANKIWRI